MKSNTQDLGANVKVSFLLLQRWLRSNSSWLSRLCFLCSNLNKRQFVYGTKAELF